MVRSFGVWLFFACTGLLSGCASISSAGLTSDNKNDGIVYYMPMKSFIVTVSVGDNEITSVVLSTTEAYADRSVAYVLRYGRSVINKVDMSIGVDTNGLLNTTSKATITSGVSDVVKGLGEFKGSRGVSAFAGKAVAASCAKGTHVFIVVDEEDAARRDYCGLKLSITRIPTAATMTAARAAAASTGARMVDLPTHRSPTVEVPTDDAPGIYYRQAQPFLLRLAGAINTEKVLTSPSGAPVLRMPVAKTFFANGEVEYEFKDGMPMKYRQSADGELAALIKLPAQFIQAYASAVGSLFDSFKTARENEAGAIAAQIELELAKQKGEACIAAIKAKDEEAITRLECGK